jgi:stalled ribosome rescue protein Dom34
MKKKIGLWIDHREAVIVEITDKAEQIIRIISDAEKQIRFEGGSRKDGLQITESVRGKKLDAQRSDYFEDIIAHIRDAELIQIFGPGEAKNQLAKHLEQAGLKERILEVATMDNMTDNQVAAKVRERFLAQDVI